MKMLCCIVVGYYIGKRQILSVFHYYDNMIARTCWGPAYLDLCGVCVCVCVCVWPSAPIYPLTTYTRVLGLYNLISLFSLQLSSRNLPFFLEHIS